MGRIYYCGDQVVIIISWWACFAWQTIGISGDEILYTTVLASLNTKIASHVRIRRGRWDGRVAGSVFECVYCTYCEDTTGKAIRMQPASDL